MFIEQIKIIKGDITTFEGDVIVNAAKSSLKGGSGVDGAIHKAAGESVLIECLESIKTDGPVPTGHARITNAGNLKCKNIIHAVGPIWVGGSNNEAYLLNQCYLNCMELVKYNSFKTVAFPCISTGVYAFPKQLAAEIAINAVFKYDIDKDVEITFVCFDDENFEIMTKLYAKLWQKHNAKCFNCNNLKEKPEGVCKQGRKEYIPGEIYCKISGREIFEKELHEELFCYYFEPRIKK